MRGKSTYPEYSLGIEGDKGLYSRREIQYMDG
jgi:hypothetical protein